ncbi:UNVERIFIED_ORG: uncharacterized DUF497 family protein [Xanthobacter viscosus]|uniref:BrnT family toxin n=1 Tax=Xanthobacter autotrophicus TaxID=280 RepID=A0A6C1KRX4_XANAU|nr:BrnT family toxin [Xanthobacter autotrophicus]TLX42886.1 BrnT family toxin [Xanthobacter autotrophicus]
MGETDDLEWHDDKDAANRVKHGLPLFFAAVIFDGRPRFERLSPKQVAGEARVEAMAEVADRVLFCVYIWRGTRRRIISVRAAHRSERRAYEKATRGS